MLLLSLIPVLHIAFELPRLILSSCTHMCVHRGQVYSTLDGAALVNNNYTPQNLGHIPNFIQNVRTFCKSASDSCTTSIIMQQAASSWPKQIARQDDAMLLHQELMQAEHNPFAEKLFLMPVRPAQWTAGMEYTQPLPSLPLTLLFSISPG